jgi:hypothetical protein
MKENTVDSVRTHLLLAKPYYVEALQIYSKIDGPTHANTVGASSQLKDISRKLYQLLMITIDK